MQVLQVPLRVMSTVCVNGDQCTGQNDGNVMYWWSLKYVYFGAERN